MRRVPQEAFFSTARMFRTVEGGGFGTARFRKRIALGCPEYWKAGGSCLREACLPPDGAEASRRRSGAWRTF